MNSTWWVAVNSYRSVYRIQHAKNVPDHLKPLHFRKFPSRETAVEWVKRHDNFADERGIKWRFLIWKDESDDTSEAS